MPSDHVRKAAEQLAARKWTVAFAESASAGRAAAEFALTEQSGAILIGGIICYDATIKEKVLAISADMIKKYTPESREVTDALAYALGGIIEADIHVAITGLTTPGGSESTEKPVGTMFVTIAHNKGAIALQQIFKGSSEDIILQMIDLVAKNLTAMAMSEKF